MMAEVASNASQCIVLFHELDARVGGRTKAYIA